MDGPPYGSMPSGFPKPISRRKSLALLMAGATGTFANGCWIEPSRLSVTRTTIPCPRLPPALHGLRIGLLADIHYKPDRDEDLLTSAVETLMAERPDIITLPGDFIDHSPHVLAPMLRILSQLDAPLGVFASPGNHDGWNVDKPTMARAFEQAGISFLINRNTLVSARGENLSIAGTDHVWQGNPDPARTLRGICRDSPLICLVHEPDYFDTMCQAREITLQVSGHTHGGQCKVPLIGYAPARVAYGQTYLEGAYSRGHSRLFVTRGLGTSTLRVRFACPPEIAILTLSSTAAIPS